MRRKHLKRKFGDAKCAYCGGECQSADHVPPQCLFANPKKEELIEVPSCIECNNSFSKDDEYLKTVLGIVDFNEAHEEVKRLQSSITRSFSNKEKKGFVQSFVRALKIIPRYTASGLYVGHAPAFDIDKKRLLRVAERVVKGLFYHERQYRFPDNFVVTSSLVEDFVDDLKCDAGESGSALRRMVQGVMSRPSVKIGNNVFEYRVGFLDNHGEPNQSVWLLEFYGSVGFLCLTHEREAQPVLVTLT